MSEQFLIDNAIPYLECFLIENKSFYPFAMIMDNDMNVNIISPEIDDEYPTSEYLIKLYERGINREYEKGRKYILGLICVDVLVNNGDNGQNAVEFRLISPSTNKKLYLKYIIEKDSIRWGKLSSPILPSDW